MTLKTKTCDSKGRLTLGHELAGKVMIMETLPNGTIRLTPAVVMPDNAVSDFTQPKKD